MFVETYTHPLVLQALRDGELVVARTDTLYGVLAMANHREAVERLRQVRQRPTEKSFITLVDHLNQLHEQPPKVMRDHLLVMWPGPYSFILPAETAPEWLRHSDDTVAYRMPHHPPLRGLLRQTGPLVAPSANPPDQPPARTAQAAFDYFGDHISVYIDTGEVLADTESSRLIRLADDGTMEILR
jgi:L-threonylcarbamoyladenylate synthase